jgi:enoyl-CoA hydratase
MWREQNVKNQNVPAPSQVAVTMPNDGRRMLDIPLSPEAKVTVERREQIVLIGINRPQMLNRIDPETFYRLATAYDDFDNDSTLRAAVLFGHGENFSRGNDVEAFSALAKTGKAFTLGEGQLDPLGRGQRLSKPLVVVVHGDTWNMGHEVGRFPRVARSFTTTTSPSCITHGIDSVSTTSTSCIAA